MTQGTMSEREAAFRAGVADMLPMVIGVAAWGLVTGVAIAQSPLSTAQALTFMLLAFAGSAQLATLPLIIGNAPVWVTTLTALVVNLRFVIYSVALARPLAHLRFRHRLWLSYLIGDIPFALYTRKLAENPAWPQRAAYFAGIVLPNWASWQGAQLLGYALGSRVPREWGLELAGTLALIPLLVPMVRKGRGPLVGVLVTSVLSVLAYHFPLRLGVLVAIVGGVLTAFAVDWLPGHGLKPRLTEQGE